MGAEENHLDAEEQAAIDRILADEQVPSEVKEIAREQAERYGYDPSIGGASS